MAGGARGGRLVADEQVRGGLSRAAATTAAARSSTRSSSSRSTARRRCSAPSTRTSSRTRARRRTWPSTSPCLEPGDTILSLELSHGGHLTHGLKVNFSGRLYTIVHYGVVRETNVVDYDEVLALAKEHRPKLIVCGGSAYPRIVEADRFRAIADEVGALLLCDMAHFAGLVAAGLHPNPVPHCDFVTSTTHKTLAGPRAGFVLCREEHAQAVDRAVFPGMQGGPLMHTIAAKATCFRDRRLRPVPRLPAAGARERRHAVRDAPGRAASTCSPAAPTRTCSSVDLRRTDWTGKDAEERLAEVAITVNRNTSRSTSGRRPSRRASASARRRRRCAASTRTTSARSARSCAARSRTTPTSARCARGAVRSATRTRSTLRLPRLHDATSPWTSHRGQPSARAPQARPASATQSTSTADFRRLVNELTLLLTYEATKDLATEDVEV